MGPGSPSAFPPGASQDGESEFAEFVEDVDAEADVAHEVEESQPQPQRPGLSRRSTVILKDDDIQQDANVETEGPLSRAGSGEQLDLGSQTAQHPTDGLVETVIEWKEGGNSVYVTGSFTGWRQMIPMRQFDSNTFAVVLKLAPGTHRLRFVVDGELRCSDYMQTATDSMGNLVNYMEVEEVRPIIQEPYESLETVAQKAPDYEYTQEIPEIFVEPEALERLASSDFTTPPQVPPHLDGVILNANWSEKDNNSVLPIPNHVVLNHLATTSIKHNVLAVASVSRYASKYVTQILYSPIAGS